MVLITGGVIVLALAGIVALQLLPGSGHSGPAAPGTRTAAGILVPAVATDTGTAQGRSLGRGDAPVTLTVWSDFQCPSCKVFSDTIEPRLVANYVVPGKLRIVYRDMNIIGPESEAAATAARCADQQGKFWPYHDVLFANQKAENSGAITPGHLQDIADAVGLDRKAFDACLPSTALVDQVQAETREGLTRGRSTPTLDFGSRVIAGSPPYDQLKVIVDGLIASAGGSPAASGGASPAGTTGAPPASSGPSATP